MNTEKLVKKVNKIDNIEEQLDNMESDKADIKVELLDTLACNNVLFKLKNNEIVYSKTKNWYEFASAFFTIPPEWCLEELEEEDESICF